MEGKAMKTTENTEIHQDNPIDMIDTIKFKLDFILDVISAPEGSKPLNLSKDGASGLFFVLANLRDELKATIEVLHGCRIQPKG